jgi:hypothetical protein
LYLCCRILKYHYYQNRNLEIDFDNWELEERLAWCASEPQE